ncbi:hypothetical protein ACHAXA_006801 [Cyclostephanos tholiformis]|uniref:Cellulase n=1 Tax=Cyclostephanos tholiformis TaxID=382380 RepID=A0ABD3RQS3_9STRA
MRNRLFSSIIFVGAAAFISTASAGYCNWGPLGTGASSTCDGGVQGGTWCNANQSQCETGCGGKWCTNDGGGPPSPTPPTPTSPTPPTGGARTATTTRYWDCSGGSCGCSYIPTGLSGAEPAMCHSNAMFVAPSNNPYGAKFYGTAAISESLGGGNWMSSGCGKCWKVTGTSNVPGFSGLSTTLVLKGTNFCPNENPMCKQGPHFDIAAPGFDVLEFSFSNACSRREPNEAAVNDAGNLGPLGTGASSTCDGLVQGGTWCNANQSQCETGCGGKWCYK